MKSCRRVSLVVALLFGGVVMGQQLSERGPAPVDQASFGGEGRILKMTSEPAVGGGIEILQVEFANSWVLVYLSPVWEGGERTTSDETPLRLELSLAIRFDKTSGKVRVLKEKGPSLEAIESGIVAAQAETACVENACGGACCGTNVGTKFCIFCNCCQNGSCAPPTGGCIDLQ